jgi:hypothetical protein
MIELILHKSNKSISPLRFPTQTSAYFPSDFFRG